MGVESFFLILAFGLAGLDWAALLFDWRKVDFIAKPGVIFALLIGIGVSTSLLPTKNFLLWIQIALVCSLAGDVLLMLPNERFLPGLITFVLAYLAYTIAFTPSLPSLSLASIITVLVCGLVVFLLLRAVIISLNSSGKERMKKPATIFGSVIFLMVSAALLTNFRPAWPDQSAVAIGLGAVLIFFSDALLSWNRFVRPIHSARLKIRIPYHLGQISIALGALLFIF